MTVALNDVVILRKLLGGLPEVVSGVEEWYREGWPHGIGRGSLWRVDD